MDVDRHEWKDVCTLCQKKGKQNEKLLDPQKNVKLGHEDPLLGYRAIASRIIDFHDEGKLPFTFPHNLLALCGSKDERKEALAGIMRTSHALWHRKCYLKISGCHIQRLTEPKDPPSSVESASTSPVKTRGARPKYDRTKCIFDNIFCGPKGSMSFSASMLGPLCRVGTPKCNDNIKSLGAALNSVSLNSRISDAFDLMAQDALYHNVCYLTLKNKVRDIKAAQSQAEKDENREAHYLSLTKIISYLHSERYSAQTRKTFKMAEVLELYENFMAESGYPACDKNVTRLTESLLSICPLLTASVGARKKGTVITFEEDASAAVISLFQSENDSEKIPYIKAATLLRNSILEQRQTESSSTVPQNLIDFLRMVTNGPNNVDTKSDERAILSIAELLSYHTVSRHRSTNAQRKRRHQASNETDAPVYLALKIFTECKKKGLVEFGSKLGVNVSYKRIMAIVDSAAETVATTYNRQGVVCPPSFQPGVFITGAADNLDHDPSSETAKTAFHGTVISLVQHNNEENPGLQQDVTLNVQKAQTQCNLPVCYTDVKTCFLNPTKARNSKSSAGTLMDSTRPPLELERAWQQKILDGNVIGWSAHRAQHDRGPKYPASIEALPVFRESANSIKMMRHAMKIVQQVTKFLNPRQTPVMAVDQPLFALCKQIQYLDEAKFGPEKFFVMFGGLHLEMNILKILGEWLEASGWGSALVQSGVTTIGRAQSMTSASHIKRTRYAHEVTLAVLFLLQQAAYNKYVEGAFDTSLMSYDEWHTDRCQNVPHFLFWDTVMHLELSYFQFVGSIRSGDLSLYIESLRRLTPWFFALDHTNYARWVPVHLQDLDNLQPDLKEAFSQGKFAVQKSKSSFSRMAMDQAHEQINAELKGDGGIIGITENEKALRTWLIAGPILSKMILNFERKTFPQKAETTHHHSENVAAQLRFQNDVHNLLVIFEELGNPFLEEDKELFNIDSKEVASEDVVNTVKIVQSIGEQQYREFVRKRLLEGSTLDIKDTIHKNKLPLFSFKLPKVKKANAKIKSIKTEYDIVTRFTFACQKREGDLSQLFSHEFHDYPPALFEADGTMRQGTKSDLIGRLLKYVDEDEVHTRPEVDAKILDGAAIVHFIRPNSACGTFGQYSQEAFLPYLRRECKDETVQRLDVVFDRYLPRSLKSGTRSKRGEGDRIQIRCDTPIPGGAHNWPNVLKNGANKKQLFTLLASHVEKEIIEGKELYATLDENVVTGSGRENFEAIAPCNQEEADGRLLLHVADAASHGCRRVMVRTVDTDVLVLAVYSYHRIEGLEELWVSIGADKHHRMIPAHEIADSLGPVASAALPALHAFTGCDTVSAFFKRGKVSAVSTWDNHPEVTPAFVLLTQGEITSDVMAAMERYVCLLYDGKTEDFKVNEVRKNLTGRTKRQQDSIPPTLDALKQHTLRASLQAQIWGDCLHALQEERDPTEWGWKSEGANFHPVWKTSPTAEKACKVLTSCKNCKNCSKNSCPCRRAGYECTPEICSCSCNKV